MRLLITFIVFVLVIGACKRAEEVAPDIGLQFYSLRNEFKKDIPATLEMINNWGIEIIEGGETYGMELDQFADLVKEHNLQVVSVGASVEQLKDSLPIVVQRAKAFDATYVMCPWIPHEGDNFTIENVNYALEIFNAAGEKLTAEGLQLVYHPHGYEFRPYQEGNLFDYMVTNSDFFDFEMDVYWFTHGGVDPLSYLNKYPDQFKLLHLKDMQQGVQGNDTGHEDVETNVVLGSGVIDIASLVQRAREIGIEYMFIEDESSRAVDQIPQSLDFISSLR